MGTTTNVKMDYYEVLSVSRDCSDQELKAAYRKLAMEFHPDRNSAPGAEDKFKQASEAYQVLSDPDKRAAYDRFGHAGVSGAGPQGNPFGGQAVDLGDIFGDIFGEMFNMGGGGGRGGRQSRAQRGRDLQFELTLEFEEAVFGKETEISVQRMEACESCKGSGAAKGKQPITCPACKGHGQVRFQQGFFQMARTCGSCGGTGTLIVDPCPACKGDGRQQKERTISVKVPAGVEDGTRIRYSGEGDAGRLGGPAGDLYVLLDVKAHKFLERDGDNLHCVVPISFPQATLGAEIEIETLEGPHILKIPEGTQSGKEFRIRHKGVPYLNRNGKGDLIVEVTVQTPTKLTKAQRDLMRQLDETISVVNTPGRRSLLGKMKEMFS